MAKMLISLGNEASNLTSAEPPLSRAPRLSLGAPTHFQNAVEILKDQDDRDIFAYVNLARSVEPGLFHSPEHAYLSREQVYAISVLRDCDAEWLRTWLAIARGCNNNPRPARNARSTDLPDSGLAVGFSLDKHQYLYEQGTVSTSPFHATPFKPLHCNLHTASEVALDRTCQQNASRISSKRRTNKTSPETSLEKEQHLYWCTVCDVQRSYKNRDDWKKHEKEHEATYICKLGITPGTLQRGFNDTFGNIQKPDDGLSGAYHGSSSYALSSPDHFSCKRRHDMVNHLSKHHGIHEISQGRELADQLKHAVHKQGWSCGFCIAFFTSFQERLRHIGTEHFEKHQNLGQWDISKVIRGLLLQPLVTNAWRDKVESLSPWEHSDLIWDKADSKDLQDQLERGPSLDVAPRDLAEAAYLASRCAQGHTGPNDMEPRPADFDKTAKTFHVSPPTQYQAIASQEYESLQDQFAASIRSDAPVLTNESEYGIMDPLPKLSFYDKYQAIVPQSLSQSRQSRSKDAGMDFDNNFDELSDEEEGQGWTINPALLSETGICGYFNSGSMDMSSSWPLLSHDDDDDDDDDGETGQ